MSVDFQKVADSTTVSISSLPDIDINDISKGTQTNDVKITLDGEEVDIRNLVFATDKVDVSGSSVSISSSVTVTATDLDIRNLAFATDKVDASGSTLGSNSGVDIGDVTINNASGASAVNVQDGGNSLTVDANNLDIRDLVFASDKVDASGSSVSISSVVAGTGATNLGKAEDAGHTSGDTGVMALAVRRDGNAVASSGTTGDYEPLQTSAFGSLKITEYGINGLPNFYSNVAGLFDLPSVILADPATATIAGVNTNNALKVAGDIANDAVDSLNPVKVGAKAVTNNASLTAIGNLDRADLTTDRKNRLIVDSDALLMATGSTSSSTFANLLAGQGAGTKIQVYAINIVGETKDIASVGATFDMEGVKARFGTSTATPLTVWTLGTQGMDGGASYGVNLNANAHFIEFKPSHWDGGDNEAFQIALMGLSGAGVLNQAHVTIWYKVMPT